MNLSSRLDLVQKTINEYHKNISINFNIIISFYNDFINTEIHNNELTIIEGSSGKFWCKKCNIKFLNIHNHSIICCPDCKSIDQKKLIDILLDRSRNIIKTEKLIDGPQKKNWFEVFKCTPDNENFLHKTRFRRINSIKAGIYDDLSYSYDILAIGNYWPTSKFENNKETKNLLDLKSCVDNAIIKYSKILHELISEKAILCSIPPSQKQTVSGIDYVIHELCLLSNSRENLTSVQSANDIFNLKKTLLIRTLDIPTKHKTDSRNYSLEDESIHLNKNVLNKVVGKSILLLDDITTTGNSFIINSKKILNAGAKRVICLALGKTQQ